MKIESQEEVSQEGIKEKPMQSLEELYAEMDNHEPIYQPFDSIHYTIENFRENLVEEHGKLIDIFNLPKILTIPL